MADDEHWAADTMISFPEPPTGDVPVLTDFEGFGFSMNGICHNITQADVEELTMPMFAPEGFIGRVDDEIEEPE